MYVYIGTLLYLFWIFTIDLIADHKKSDFLLFGVACTLKQSGLFQEVYQSAQSEDFFL